ncbi:MAG: M48 family metallopeptidase [Eubacteriaceae bacterium]|nr:M48 family metallopeptidase [Eubacteriaceae bacterium]
MNNRYNDPPDSKYKIKYIRGNDFSLMIEDSELTVLVPKLTSDSEIQSYVQKNSRWIESTRRKGLSAKLEGSLLYKGVDYPVEILKTTSEDKLTFDGSLFSFDMKREKEKDRKNLIRDWFSRETEQMILPRIDKFKSLVGVSPGKISIENMYGRWAACSNFGNMKFHWKCGMLPEEIIDYVVVHELCHLIYLNHYPEYWNKVRSSMPDYIWRKEWLETHGIEIILD